MSVNKICSFCVSNYHFITMCMPYIGKKIESENITLFLEDDMQDIKEKFLNKVVLKEEEKGKIESLNFKKTECKYTSIDEKLSNIEKVNCNLIVYGNEDYINKINALLEKWIKTNYHKFQNINIINAYEVMEFNNNIAEILSKHNKILNTSGEKTIEEVFEGYNSIKKNVI